jgi:cellulose synthase/poly-beta-1,6-N-acetylglucosamine synthase-like glycosyltransferase
VNNNSKNRTLKDAVSVIICARNEAENLKKNLPLILEQDYKNFEVIVVNDRSEDETEDVLNKLASKYSHLKISTVRDDPKFTCGKKLALTLGIKASANEWLLLTDADCIPASKDWLSLMQRNFSQKTEIVIGYGGYIKEPGLLNLIIRFETAFTALFYLGLAKAGKPYMGVGRNLAYRKSLFFRNNGFATHTALTSGDDDLFVNETATSENTVIEMHPDSFTWSSAETSYIDWYRQKKRHLSTGSRYKTGSKYRLILENLSRVILLISFVILLSKHTAVNFVLIVFVSFLIYKSLVFKIFFSRLNERYLFLPSLILEPLIPYFYSYLHYRNFIERSRNKWK